MISRGPFLVKCAALHLAARREKQLFVEIKQRSSRDRDTEEQNRVQLSGPEDLLSVLAGVWFLIVRPPDCASCLSIQQKGKMTVPRPSHR